MSMGPLELHEIGEAVSEALPEPECAWVMPGKCDDGEAECCAQMPEEPRGQLAERVLSELQRRGWRLVREGERDG